MPQFQTHDGKMVVPVVIDGTSPPLDPSRYIFVRSASTGELLHLAQGASTDVATAAADASLRAFRHWRSSTHSQRRDVLIQAAQIMEQRVDELVDVQQRETSCSESWARFNVSLGCRILREIAANISAECTGDLPPVETAGALALVFREPIGPVLAIAPWNASLILSTRALAGPLAAGCTVVFKASELCPLTHHAVVDVLTEAGLPAGCVNRLQARREDSAVVTEALISHSAIRKVIFTGSANVGRIIGQSAGRHLKPVLMELGGKCPAVVLKDADVKMAAKACAEGAFLHHGQVCMSTERIIVERKIADALKGALTRYIEQTFADGTGFAVTTAAAARTRELVHDAYQNGASYLVGQNKWMGESKTSVEPTVLTGVNAKHRIYHEESFGPNCSLYVVDSEEEAIELANDSDYGLNASVHSRDILAALRVAKQIECGQVHVGTITEYDEPNMPIGGTKGSGWGRNNGKYALREFLMTKTISVHDVNAAIRFGVD